MFPYCYMSYMEILFWHLFNWFAIYFIQNDLIYENSVNFKRFSGDFLLPLYPKQSNMKLNRIKVVLVEKGISQTQLAEILGKSFSTVNAYCGNRQQPSLEQLHKIAEVLSVTPKDLLNDIP